MNNLYEAPSVLTISIYQKPYFSLSQALGGNSVASHNDVKLGDLEITVDAVREHINASTNNTPTCEWYPLSIGGNSQTTFGNNSNNTSSGSGSASSGSGTGINTKSNSSKVNNVWLLYLQMHMKYVLMSTIE